MSGTLINVWWPQEQSWYSGYADKYDLNRGLYVKYLDGDRCFHDLTLVKYHILSEATDVQKKKKTKFTNEDIEQVKSTVECGICMEIFVNPFSLPCTHSFCEGCIKQCFKTSKECPMCKESFLLREARHNPTLEKLSCLFTDVEQVSTNQTVQPVQSFENVATVLSSNPLHALAQVVAQVGTFKCHTCDGRKTAKSHKCKRPCPQYLE